MTTETPTVFTVIHQDGFEKVISGKTNRITLSIPIEKDDKVLKNFLLETHFYTEGEEYFTCTGQKIDPSSNAYVLKEIHRLACIAYWEKNDSLGRIIPEDILPNPDEMPEILPLFRHHAIVDMKDYYLYGKTGCVDSEGKYIPFGLSHKQLTEIYHSSLEEWLAKYN